MPSDLQELLYLVAKGAIPRSALCRQYGIARNKIDEFLDHPNIEAIVSKIREDSLAKISNHLKELQLKAIEVLHEVLDTGRKEDNRLRAAERILMGTGILKDHTELSGAVSINIAKELLPDYVDIPKNAGGTEPTTQPSK